MPVRRERVSIEAVLRLGIEVWRSPEGEREGKSCSCVSEALSLESE